jgi:integrase
MKRSNGDGTVYRRKDGRYEAALYVHTTSGARQRVRVYGKTRDEARRRLTAVAAQADTGLAVPDRAWRLGAYLDHWLDAVVRPTCRARTAELYEAIIRLHLTPALGSESLRRLSVARLQTFFNEQSAAGRSPRMVGVMRTVLGAALTQAQREELILRNPARLVRLPAWRPKEVHPWSDAEAGHFLSAAAGDPLYPAFVLLLLYGLRRGEVLGLRWRDIDRGRAVLQVRQQIQRLDGRLQQVVVKTDAGQRDLPLLPLADHVLTAHARTLAHAAAPDDLIFTTRSGQPVEPHNLARSFHRIRQAAGLPRITLHHLRHTTATLLNRQRVPVRDAQHILGHASPLTTQQIYQHTHLDDQRTALGGVERPSTPRVAVPTTTFISGGPSGTRTHDTLLKSFVPALRERPANRGAGTRLRAGAAAAGGSSCRQGCRQTHRPANAGHRRGPLLVGRAQLTWP